jgi:F-type H+-transporting ATPase subunit b
MDLINQTLNSFSAQISELPVSFNPDIFEANLVNLVILVSGIVYLGGNALSAALTERQQKILTAIQEAEERLQQSIARLAESEKQLEQAQIVITSIKTDAELTAKQIKSNILNEGKKEIERLALAAKYQIVILEAKLRKSLIDYAVNLAIKRVTSQITSKMNSTLQQQIIDRNISKLRD